MEKKEMIEGLKEDIEEYGQCRRAKGMTELMARNRKAMHKEDKFKYYEGLAKDRGNANAGLLGEIKKTQNTIAEREQTIDKLFKSIDMLCDYVRNINNNTKGKKKRYYIVPNP